MPTLRIKMPDQTEVTHVLKGELITVGRRPDNTIQILDRSVSAHHAELVLENDHYRLHDLESTNFSFVEGNQIADFHLHQSCKITFGNIECEYDASGEAAEVPMLTPAQMEKDMAFLRAENQELLNKIDGLQRRVDILSSARLITGKSETGSLSAPDQVKKLTAERDELRFHCSGLKLELEKLREELSATIRERDAARQANELLHAERAMSKDENQSGDKNQDKGTTQRIILPPHAPAEPGSHVHRASDTESTSTVTVTFSPIETASK
jgi:pSer/pThr/pTyr-binding forkhead associated (FHA) protein